MRLHDSTACVESLDVSTYRIPTESPESDGTYEWDSTTMVIVELRGGGKTGLGYTYADTSTATLINEHLKEVVVGRDTMSVRGIWDAMMLSIRNLGRPGICAMGISAIDTALWDLKAQLLGLPLVKLFGEVREAVPIYGSGGFTSYTIEKLGEQLRGWAQSGVSMVKMKIGREPGQDIERVRAAREAIDNGVDLFVDANGAYSRKQALEQAEKFSPFKVSWFEEPVSSDDLDGLRFVRERMTNEIEIAAGEYGFDLDYFQRMLASSAVDVLQADATRCGGFTGFGQAATLCEAYHIPLSAHCAPALHAQIGCATPVLRHVEYFYDHARIENMFFDNGPHLTNGALQPDLSRSGIGLVLKRIDAEKFRI